MESSINKDPNDHVAKNEAARTEDGERGEGADRLACTKHLGTFTHPVRLQYHPGKPDQEGCIAWCFCIKCLGLAQITQEHLSIMIELVNIVHGTNHRVDEFDPMRQYILGHGCMRCSDKPIFMIDEFPEADSPEAE